MDWTGGARRRFTPGNRSATVQKQKAHFAKVRASLQHTPGSERTSRPDSLHTTASRRAPSRYERHQYTDTASGRPRRLAKIPREMFRPEQRRITQDRERSEGQEFAVHLGRGAFSPSSDMLSNTPGSQSRLKVSPLIQHATASDLNPKNRLPPLENDMAQEDKLLMANRRKLLGRTDWLGLASSATCPDALSIVSQQGPHWEATKITVIYIAKRQAGAPTAPHSTLRQTSRSARPCNEWSDRTG